MNSAAVFLYVATLLAVGGVVGCQSRPTPAAGAGSASTTAEAEASGVMCTDGSACGDGAAAAAGADGDSAAAGSAAPGSNDPGNQPSLEADGSAPSVVADGVVQAASAADAGPLLPEGWTTVAEGDLTPDEVARAERAAAAMRSVGGQMMQRVVSVAAEQGYPAAIEVCSNEALGFAQAAQEEFDLRIGRTSTRLRNPSNEVPLWATPHIAAQATASAPMGEFLRGPEGQLGVLKPIMLGAVCANCHGTQDVMATGVREALALRYPRDQAIGYREGELRGWFWMEVAAN